MASLKVKRPFMFLIDLVVRDTSPLCCGCKSYCQSVKLVPHLFQTISQAPVRISGNFNLTTRCPGSVAKEEPSGFSRIPALMLVSSVGLPTRKNQKILLISSPRSDLRLIRPLLDQDLPPHGPKKMNSFTLKLRCLLFICSDAMKQSNL